MTVVVLILSLGSSLNPLHYLWCHCEELLIEDTRVPHVIRVEVGFVSRFAQLLELSNLEWIH